MNRFWSPIVSQLRPYVAGEQPAAPGVVIKLNTNENPYGPSPRVRTAIVEELDRLRLYPDGTAKALREAIAVHLGVGVDQVFAGNGSDEVLAHAFQALLNHSEPLLFPDVSYSFYPTYCKLYGIQYREIAVTESFHIDVSRYTSPCGGIVIANPNAPTGLALPRAQVAQLLTAHKDAVVLVDEAYVDFGAETAVPLLAQFPNLLIVKTFSKSHALAGLRVGFALGHVKLIEALQRVKDSFNSYPVDRLAIAGATAAIQDQAWLDETRKAVMTTRERLSKALEGLDFEVLPSKANFVFARHRKAEARALASALRRRAILVRHFDLPRIDQFLRITVGTDSACDALLEALRIELG
jgi:histidinol-phosphate aminotransferase